MLNDYQLYVCKKIINLINNSILDETQNITRDFTKVLDRFLIFFSFPYKSIFLTTELWYKN